MTKRNLIAVLFLCVFAVCFIGSGCGDEGNGSEIIDGIPGGPGEAEIYFTYVPPLGSYDNLGGQVLHVDPNDCFVVVFIYVSDWWVKPYWADPFTDIRQDGRFTTDITTGGIDSQATKIIAFLFQKGYDPSTSGSPRNLPQELYDNALDYALSTR